MEDIKTQVAARVGKPVSAKEVRKTLGKTHMPTRGRVRKGKPFGRIIWSRVVEINGVKYEKMLHATKGWRLSRAG